MGKDFESWFHQWPPEGQFLNAKSLKLPFDIGMQNVGIPCAMPCTNVAPMSGGPLPTHGFPEQPNFKGGHLMDHHGLYCLPQFRQGFMPDTNHHERLMPEADILGKVHNEIHGEVNSSPTDPQRAPKQFLVFDRTGNKTTFILSSMIGTPNQPLNCWNQKKPGSHCNVSGLQLGNGSSILHSGPNLTDEFDDENGIGELHEDSEDIDALLSSDDEDNFTDDEETSTGRSPSTMTAYEKQDWFDENEDLDEVASSAGPSKRQKLSDISYEVPSITYTSSSPNHKASFQYEDDAESSCAGVPPTSNEYDNTYSLSGTKRERKEKIRETVNILQTILPDGNGKDAVVVLDKAINYLKSLKCKAKSLELSGPLEAPYDLESL